MKKTMKFVLAMLAVAGMVQSASALEAEISSAGEGGFYLTGNIGKLAKNKNVAITVYKPDKTAKEITRANPLDALYSIGQAIADNSGDFRYFVAVDGELNNFSRYRVVVSDYTGEEVSLYAVANPLSINVDMEGFGHNYFDATNVKFNVKVADSACIAAEADVNMKIYDSATSELLYEDTYEGVLIDGNGNGHISDNVSFSKIGKKYGTFKAVFTVSASGMGEACYTTSFANARKSTNLNRKVGIQHHFGNGFTQTLQKEVVELFADAGYGLARDNINWSFYEKNDDEFVMYDFVETYMDEADNSGVKMLMTTSNGNSKIVSDSIIASDESLEEYGEYVYNMVYDTVDKVSSYEIMNEVNHYEKNPDKKMTPEQYFNVVKVASENAKAAAEQKSKDTGKTYKAEICAGALAYVTYEDAEMIDWVDALFELGIGEYIDTFSHHIYTQTKSPEASVKEDVADEVREIIDGYGYTDMPIVLSEVGYSSTSDYENSEYRQAMYELRDLALVYDKYDEIYLYCGINKQNEDDEYERELGHINTWLYNSYNNSGVAYAAKPAYVAMANFNALLSNAELLERNEESFLLWDLGGRDYVFKNADGVNVHMMWNSKDKDDTYELSDMGTSVTLYDMYGNEQQLTSSTGKYTINIGAAPVYVVENTRPITIQNAAGTEITSLEDTVYLKADGLYSDTFAGTMVVAAVYNGDRMTSCKLVSYDELLKERTNIAASGGNKMCVFVFENLNDLKPEIRKIEIRREED